MNPLARSSEVTVRHGHHVVTLRPTLRAAMTLERLHDGWPRFVVRLGQFSLETVQALIRASAVSGFAAEALLHSFENRPLAEIKAAVAEPLAELMALFLSPLDGDDTGEKTSPALTQPKPWSETYAELFRLGTGWLGWSPAETWAATPAEIAQAFEGKIAHLIAVNGGSDQSAPGQTNSKQTAAQRQANIEAGLDPDFDRAGLARLKAM